MTTTTVAERVQAGARWLDEHEPAGWADRINLDQLDLASCLDCVLGQLGPDDFIFTGARLERGLTWRQAGALGFNVGPDVEYGWEITDQYDELTAAWREEIMVRRAGGAA